MRLPSVLFLSREKNQFRKHRLFVTEKHGGQHKILASLNTRWHAVYRTVVYKFTTYRTVNVNI